MQPSRNHIIISCKTFTMAQSWSNIENPRAKRISDWSAEVWKCVNFIQLCKGAACIAVGFDFVKDIICHNKVGDI